MDNETLPVLSPATLPELYGNGIFQIDAAPAAARPQAAPRADKRRHLVLSNEAVEGPLMELLAGIIQACRIEMKDVHIMHLKGQGNYTELLDNYGPSYVIMFGTEPAQIDLPIVFPQFQLQKFSNATWVASPELGLIRNDKSMKTKLWNCLKTVYGI